MTVERLRAGARVRKTHATAKEAAPKAQARTIEEEEEFSGFSSCKFHMND